jgi:hypothetical protein
MQNPNKIARTVQAAFDDIGGEPLAGSGFEDDESQPESEDTELVHGEQGAPGED